MLIHDLKRWVVLESGISQGYLHVIVGMLLFTLFWTYTRRHWPALVLVATFQGFNELNDLIVDHALGHAARWDNSSMDTAVTMAIPTSVAVVFVMVRWVFAGVDGRRDVAPAERRQWI